MSAVPVPPGGPKYFLPMWRWGSPTSGLHQNLGVGLGDQAQSIIVSAAGAVLTGANFLWEIAAYLIAFVSDPSNDLAKKGSLLGSVNRFVADIGGSLIVGPIPWLLLAFALLLLAFGFMRGRLSVSGAIRCVASLTLLTIMVSAAGSANPDHTVGSPSWAINKGVGISDALANSVTGQLQNVHQHLTPFGAGVPEPNCAQYVTALEQQAQANGATPVEVGLSDLWDHAFLPQWTRVQFGVDGEGFKAACHYLDNAADPGPVNASNTVQWQIANAGGYPAGSPSPQTGGVYGPWQDDDSMERGMIAWAWCDSAGGWHTDGDFKAVEAARHADGTECQKWYTQTNTSASGQGQTNKIGGSTGNGAFDNHSFPSSNSYAHQFVAWFDGHFTWTALILALCAILAALGFGWMFAGIALIVLLSQAGLLVLLFLAPVLLLVMAWPGEAAGKVPGAVARAFGLCLAAKAFFYLLLAGLISLFQLFFDVIPANYGSPVSAILIAAIPLLVIAASWYLTKKFGWSNMLSPKGALKVAGNAGSWVTKRMGGGGGATGLGPRVDRKERPRGTDDPERPRDRDGERSSGIAATAQGIRELGGVGRGKDSAEALAARKRAMLARAPDTTGMAPGEFAASKGFEIGPPRAKRPEEIRNWNAGDASAAAPPEHSAWMADRYRELVGTTSTGGSSRSPVVGKRDPLKGRVRPGRLSR